MLDRSPSPFLLPEASRPKLAKSCRAASSKSTLLPGTLLWFVEEVGELVRAIRRGERDNLEEEFGDVYAWLVTLASLHGIDLETVARTKYGDGCPRCRATPCSCPHPSQP